MLGKALSIPLAAFAIGMLILVHELGHFLAAKLVGVRVEIFSIGFWKKIVAFKWGDTEYRLSIIPLGGYLKMAGDMVGEGTGAPGEFCSKSPGQRAFVFVAGVAMNMVLAVVGFILAFAIGVRFRVAEIGMLEQDYPAWEAGLREGDRIVEIDGLKDPDFQDVARTVGLGGRGKVMLRISRGEEEISLELEPRFDEKSGIRRLGFRPPSQTVVTGLYPIRKKDGRWPAREAGIKLEDRILSVNGKEVHTFREVHEELSLLAPGTIQVVVERGTETLTFDVLTEAMPQHIIGISCVSAEVESLQGGGLARQMGMTQGDVIISVNQQQVKSIVEVEDIIKAAYGPVQIAVDRAGEQLTLNTQVPDKRTLNKFLFSLHCTDSAELTWVMANGPAALAGMEAGDTLLEVGGKRVESWKDILRAGARAGEEPRTIKWRRGDATFSAEVTPKDEPRERRGFLGCTFSLGKYRVRQHGVWKSVKVGVRKTYDTVAEIFLFLRGISRGDVSGKQVGSVVVIAYGSYLAAREGVGKLLYLTAMISAALAFINILPIPVLDGGYLVFVAIEKIRGRPVSEKVMAISHYIGISLLLVLVAYAIRNDILRFLNI